MIYPYHSISTQYTISYDFHMFLFQLGVKLPLNYKVIYILPPDFSGRRVVRGTTYQITPRRGIPGDLRDRITRFLSLDWSKNHSTREALKWVFPKIVVSQIIHFIGFSIINPSILGCFPILHLFV